MLTGESDADRSRVINDRLKDRLNNRGGNNALARPADREVRLRSTTLYDASDKRAITSETTILRQKLFNFLDFERFRAVIEQPSSICRAFASDDPIRTQVRPFKMIILVYLEFNNIFIQIYSNSIN